MATQARRVAAASVGMELPAVIDDIPRLQRWLWTAAGAALFALGAVGVVLPLLPTVVFWIGAVACFTRGHPALAERILAHPRCGPPIRLYLEHGVIARAGKRAAIIAMAISALLTAVLSRSLPVSLGVAGTLALVALYVATRPEEPPALAREPADAPR